MLWLSLGLNIPARGAVVLRMLILIVGWMLALTVAAAEVVLLKQNSEPKYLANGQGLCDQLYAAISERLQADGGYQPRIDPAFYPVKRIMKMLEEGQGTLFCGAEATAERDKTFRYAAVPAYTITNVIATGSQQPERPLTLADIKAGKIVIAALYGTSSAAWLKAQLGSELVFDQIYSVEQGVELVANHSQPGYFFYHDLALNHFAAQHPGEVKILPTVYRTLPQWLLLSPHADDKLVQRLDAIMAELAASGRLAQIQDQFLRPLAGR